MIKFENVSFGYGKSLILDRFNLSLEPKGATVLSGPSGCGKTTLLRLIAGLEKPVSGTVSGLPGIVGYMFQEDRLLPWLTALQNVAAVCSGEQAQETARLWLERVELDSAQINALPSELSGGQIRRVALARALAYECSLLLFDEPFKGLDSALSLRMAALVLEHSVPLIAVIHSEEEAANLGGTRLLFEGPPLRRSEAGFH